MMAILGMEELAEADEKKGHGAYFHEAVLGALMGYSSRVC